MQAPSPPLIGGMTNIFRDRFILTLTHVKQPRFALCG